MSKYLLVGFVFLFAVACQQSKGLPDLDLLKYGVGMKLKAPEGAEVKVNDMGIAKDISIQSGATFYIQILNSSAINFDAKTLKEEELQSVQASEYFSKLVQEDAHGFIFEKDFGDDNINYDFRYFKIQGDQEYRYQAGLIGKFTEEDVRIMYEAVQ